MSRAPSAIVRRRSASALTGSIADGGAGVGGNTRVAIVLRNTSDVTCILQGWPGISFVGGGDGTQIGAPAVLDRSAPHPLTTLRPGGEAQANVQLRPASDWDTATCEPRVVDGFRVLPPGSSTSLFVGASGPLFEACANPSAAQLTAAAIEPS